LRVAVSEALGLIAGEGRLPLEVARSARRRGLRVAVVAFRGLADPGIDAEAAEVSWLHPGEVGAAVGALRSAGARRAVMAGKVSKETLFRDPGSLRLDAQAVRLIGQLADRRDDSILGLVAEFLEEQGIRLMPQADLVPELLAGEGTLGHREPTPAQLSDLAFGWNIAKAIGELDIGQTVVVKDRAVLAVEAVEGTDAAILRGGAIGEGACVVKVAKPNQDPRFDLPAIGPDTISTLVEARAGMLAVEAGQTLVLDRERVVEGADAHGIALLGVAAGRLPRGTG
jgi:DUF1009 family protein